MRLLLMIIIGLGVAGVAMYYYTSQQNVVLTNVNELQNAAEQAVEKHRQNQQNMMDQLQ